MAEIHLSRVRAALPARRDPHWQRLEKGKFLGFRKLGEGAGSWIARLRADDGRQHFRALGVVTDKFDYDAAKKDAEAWFGNFEVGVTDAPATIADACRDYVAALEADGRGKRAAGDRRKDPEGVPGWGAAHDADMRFKRLVFDVPFGKILLDKITTTRLREWRNGVPGSKDGQNRNWDCLRAALNLAVVNRRVNPMRMQEWRSVKKHKNAKRRRDVFLDLKQRRALLEACGSGALHDLVAAAMTTAARPGELVNAIRRQFDARTGTMEFIGKTGPRRVPLSPAAVAVFKRAAKDKLPGALLFPADGGKPWGHSGWDEGFKAAAKAAKLPDKAVLYSCRHSAITEMLRAGMSTLDTARIVGTSLEMLQENYGHLVEDAARERLAEVALV